VESVKSGDVAEGFVKPVWVEGSQRCCGIRFAAERTTGSQRNGWPFVLTYSKKGWRLATANQLTTELGKLHYVR
jgi:hypothetical protein